MELNGNRDKNATSRKKKKEPKTLLWTLRNFAETSTVKGVPKIVKSKTRLLRIIWLAAVLFGATIASLQTHRLLAQYCTYSTVLSIKETLDQAPFPDITICNLSPLTEVRAINITMEQFMDALNRYPQSELHRMYASEIKTMPGYFQNVDQHRLDKHNMKNSQFIVECSWDAMEHIDCPKVGVIPTFNPEYHICYTFSTGPQAFLPVSEGGVTEFSGIFYLNDFSNISFPNISLDAFFSHAKGVKVFIHPPNTIPSVMHRGINVPPGHEISFAMSATKRMRQEYPHGSCVQEKFLFNDTKHAYTKQGCQALCNQHIVIKYCQCLYPYFLTTEKMRRQYPFCGRLESNFSITAERLQCLGMIPNKELYTAGVCECGPPCQEYIYHKDLHQVPWPHESYQLAAYSRYIKNKPYEDKFKFYEDVTALMMTNSTSAFEKLRGNDLLRRNFLQINVYFEPYHLIQLRDEPSLTMETLMANVGGVLNLWVGVTFITLVEIGELLYHLLSLGVHKNKCGERKAPPREGQTVELMPNPL